MAESLRHKAFTSVLWNITEVGGRQIVGFVISVVLARLIMPDQFGAIAMLSIFYSLMSVFVDCGFTQALLRKEDRTQMDCCTVFWFNIAMSCVCYLILFFCAPFIARFYNLPILCPVLRVQAIGLIIGALCAVQNTLFASSLNFKVLAKYNILAQLISGVSGIIFAYMGFEVWALVFQQLIATSLRALFLWIKSQWRPVLMFSRKVLGEFFSFGSRLLASSLLNTTYENLYGLFIGKFYNASQLAFYNRGQSISQLTSSLPTGVLQSVTFPTLSKVQHDYERLRVGYQSTLRVASFVIFPLCLGAGAVAFPLINVLFTSVWMYSATLLTIIVFGMMWYPIHSINLNLLIVKGRSDFFLKLEVVKKIIGVTIMLITIPIGIEAICWGTVASSIISLFVNSFYTGRLINLGYFKQMRDYLPSLLLSLAMFALVRFECHLLGNGILSLIAGIATGAVFYISLAFLFRFKELALLMSLLKSR